MLKKMIILLGILMILVPTAVNAEMFKNGDITYVLEQVKLEHDILENADFLGMDSNGNYIFQIEKAPDVYTGYKANTKECVEMTIQEMLDFVSGSFKYREYIIEDYDVYLLKSHYLTSGYMQATEYIDSKTYWEWTGEYYEEVINPDPTNITNYYVEKYITLPASAKIESGVTYYTFGERGLLDKVETPTSDQIENYVVIVDDDKAISKTKIATLDKTIFEPVMATCDVYIDAYSEETGELYLVAFDYNTGVAYLYDKKGNKIEGLDYIEIYSDTINGAYDKQSKFKILNKAMEELFVDEGVEYYKLRYKDYVVNLEWYDSDTYEQAFYNIYEYKLLSKDNQEYNNKALTIEMSGRKDRIKAITVNGKELNKDNYSLSGDITTITLKKAYLETLTKGDYVLEVEYIDGVKVKSTFVKKTNPVLDDTPQTGSYQNVVMLGSTLSVALVGLTGTVVYSRKKD